MSANGAISNAISSATSGLLSQSDLSGYVTTEEMDSAIANSGHASASDLSALQTTVTQLAESITAIKSTGGAIYTINGVTIDGTDVIVRYATNIRFMQLMVRLLKSDDSYITSIVGASDQLNTDGAEHAETFNRLLNGVADVAKVEAYLVPNYHNGYAQSNVVTVDVPSISSGGDTSGETAVHIVNSIFIHENGNVSVYYVNSESQVRMALAAYKSDGSLIRTLYYSGSLETDSERHICSVTV